MVNATINSQPESKDIEIKRTETVNSALLPYLKGHNIWTVHVTPITF